MKYISTRGNHAPVESAFAIKTGMAPRGGLFVPETVPVIDPDGLRKLPYQEVAYRVLSPFLTDYTETELRESVAAAYGPDRFDSPDVAPLKYLDKTTVVQELWHGPTAAFKDLALQLMPRLLHLAAKKTGATREIVILVATSGDTGKAALEGFRDAPGVRIIVFYPQGGVSKIQELQMVTTGGSNTAAVAVRGNFDDCQTMVKQIFADPDYNRLLADKGFEFSSANSINWGRLVPQIAYYFFAYARMLDNHVILSEEPVNIVVPTGNFGNILAGYYASLMGLPVNRFVCASNVNNVLTDFIADGVYDRNRTFHRTSSPSMDILISSNLERFLFEVTGHNAMKIERWYEDLAKRGAYKVDETTRARIQALFSGGYATEEETFAAIRGTFDRYGYLIDTHTAVAVSVNDKYRAETGDKTVSLIGSTASPFKFNTAVYSAVSGDKTRTDEFGVLNKLSEFAKVPIHRAVDRLTEKPVLHDRVIGIPEARKTILDLLNIRY